MGKYRAVTSGVLEMVLRYWQGFERLPAGVLPRIGSRQWHKTEVTCETCRVTYSQPEFSIVNAEQKAVLNL